VKPLAHVHWLDNGDEKSVPLYDQQSIASVTAGLRREKVAYWVCMNSMDIRIPPVTQYTPRRDTLASG
jgi:hypothetical protein